MRISDWSSDVCSSDLDDRLPEHGRADHFAGGMRYDRQPFVECERAAVMMLPLSDASKRILDDDDRAVDDQAEVQRAEDQQSGRDAAQQTAEAGDRKSVVKGRSVSVGVDPGGHRKNKKN